VLEVDGALRARRVLRETDPVDDDEMQPREHNDFYRRSAERDQKS
jgi:hypothetical protein